MNASVQTVLAAYGRRGSQLLLEPLENAGGFSGARLWRVTDGAQRWCLRRWPADYPDETRLRFIHAVLEFAGMQVDIVPKLQRTTAGDTAMAVEGHLWELTTWLPGVANFHQQPSEAKLISALQALATVHRALEYFPTRMTGLGTSPGIAERRGRLEALAQSLPQLVASLPRAPEPLRQRGQSLVAYFASEVSTVRAELAAAAESLVPLQPCLRDIWHDHVLFTGDAVTGIVDWDAVRIDTVATDLARLLASLVRDDNTAWQVGLTAYEAIRPLTDAERALIPVFDRSSLLMSGMNWLDWTVLEGREFADMPRVYQRLDETLARLKQRTGGLWTP